MQRRQLRAARSAALTLAQRVKSSESEGTLTIVTQQEKSEGFSVICAIKVLANLKIT